MVLQLEPRHIQTLQKTDFFFNQHLYGILLELAYMATSGGHFSRPLGMGSFWSLLEFVIL